MNFKYVLQAVFVDEVLEKFFGQTRQRTGGNFYINIGEFMASAKTFNWHNLLKNNISPDASTKCLSCAAELDENDLEQIHDLSIYDTEILIGSDDMLRHKVIYRAGHLIFK